MIIVDASAIVAMTCDEKAASALTARLHSEDRASRGTHAVTLLEAVNVMCRYLRCTRADAEATLADFLDQHAIAVLPIDAEIGRLARDAYAQFGKGQGHPARLNLGDCFSHALAVKHGAVLLFVGDDFVAAGISSALAAR